jgi:hypothetical protein
MTGRRAEHRARRKIAYIPAASAQTVTVKGARPAHHFSAAPGVGHRRAAASLRGRIASMYEGENHTFCRWAWPLPPNTILGDVFFSLPALETLRPSCAPSRKSMTVIVASQSA